MDILNINERWHRAKDLIYPNFAMLPVSQQAEMKRLFFAGAAECFNMLAVEILRLPDNQAFNIVKSTQMELEGFTIAVKMGRA